MHQISWTQAAAKKTMSELLNLLGDAAQQFLSKNTPVFKAVYNPNFPFTFSEYAGEISPSLRNGIYVILIGSTALTMCCCGLYIRIYFRTILDCCETCCRHKRGQLRVPTS